MVRVDRGGHKKTLAAGGGGTRESASTFDFSGVDAPGKYYEVNDNPHGNDGNRLSDGGQLSETAISHGGRQTTLSSLGR
jgi:hypothetical protein